MNALRDGDAPALNPSCVVRPQGANVLIFNPRTDQLHLIPERSFRLIQMCDGVLTIAEVEATVATVSPEIPSEQVRAFFSALVTRGIVVVDRAE